VRGVGKHGGDLDARTLGIYHFLFANEFFMSS
jgi:hypothetical protein